MVQCSNGQRAWVKFTSEGTYCSTAVATVAQQIQSNTITERTRVVVKIHPELLKNKVVMLKFRNIKQQILNNERHQPYVFTSITQINLHVYYL